MTPAQARAEIRRLQCLKRDYLWQMWDDMDNLALMQAAFDGWSEATDRITRLQQWLTAMTISPPSHVM